MYFHIPRYGFRRVHCWPQVSNSFFYLNANYITRMIYFHIFFGIQSIFYFCREYPSSLIWLYGLSYSNLPFYYLKCLVPRSRRGKNGRDARQSKEWYISCNFYHYSSERFNPMIPGTPWDVGCDLLNFVCGTNMSKRKIYWRISSIQNYNLYCDQLTWENG